LGIEGALSDIVNVNRRANEEMGTSLVEETELQPRRRRSHKKSSKERYETRRKWRTIFYWLLLGVVGIVFVALIAVYAGSAGE
jgi:hypothetical protein